jgi:hypothetical protein
MLSFLEMERAVVCGNKIKDDLAMMKKLLTEGRIYNNQLLILQLALFQNLVCKEFLQAFSYFPAL